MPGVVGNVFAELERRVPSTCVMRRRPLDFLRSALQLVHALEQVLARCGQRGADHFRVGERRVGGREGIGDVLDIELRLLPGVRVNAVSGFHQFVGGTGGDEIGLLHGIENGILDPVLVLEAAVILGGRGHGVRRFWPMALAQAVFPDARQYCCPQAALHLHQLFRVLQLRLPDFAEGSADLLHRHSLTVGIGALLLRGLRHVLGELRHALIDLRQIAGQLGRVGQRGADHVGSGFRRACS